MLMQEERELVVEYGKKMSAARLSTGTSGNISIYNAEKGLVALSPSGMDYFSTTPEDVVILDLDGKVVDGKRKPSSEWALHTTFYKHKPHARAVVHTHSVYCTTLAVLGEPIDAHRFTVLGTHKRATPLFGAQREGERARHAAHEALKRKLPDEQAVLYASAIDLPRRGQKRDGDGQIEARAGLSQGAWRKVDNDFVARHLKPARPKGGPHALTRLLDRSVAHSHDREARKPV